MKASRYNIFAKGTDSVYAVNLLSRTAIELSPDYYDIYLALAQNDSNLSYDPELATFEAVLKQGMFLLENNFDELAYIRYRSHQDRFDNRELGLVITPTMSCNFSCHYCFENKTDTYLSLDAQDQILQMVASNIIGRESLSVQWFGGEPLKAMSIIEDLSRKFIPR